MLALLSKMAKQRREAIDQYSKAGRDDLAEKEKQEITIIEHYLPKPLSEDKGFNLQPKPKEPSNPKRQRANGNVTSNRRRRENPFFRLIRGMFLKAKLNQVENGKKSAIFVFLNFCSIE